MKNPGTTFKKILANILAMPIRNRYMRHRIRHCIVDFRLKDCFQLCRFLYHKIRPGCVLLVETNNCHGEVIAGYIQYFQKLGLNVDILVGKDIYEESSFCRLDTSGIQMFNSDYVVLGWFLRSSKLLEYRHVFLMSSAFYRKTADEPYASALDEFPKLRKHPSLFVVEHDLADIASFGEEELLRQNRLITLGRFDKGVFMNPILFGDCKRTPKNEVTTFITIGAIKGFRRDHRALVQAIEQLSRENLRFKVVVVGSGSLDSLPVAVRPVIQIMGRLDFPKMFESIEQADFFLPLLDAENPDHNRYITTGVTGSAQLIYAFSKVPVIHPKFASFYGFCDDNAILSENLADGMRSAIMMSCADYKAKQRALIGLATALEEESSANLRKILI